MAVTLIVNPGSSSKKYALYEGDELLLSAQVEHDETGLILCTTVNGTTDRCQPIEATAYDTSLLNFIERALNEKVLKSTTEIVTVGVRMVAPGTYFTQHRLVDEDFMVRLAKSATRAPLHIPHTLREISVLRQALPQALIVAASDSDFHARMPEKAKRYSLSRLEAETLDLYRFGYHGLSVASVIRRLSTLALKPESKVIVCHIGSGVSVTAVKNGQSIDTTMGYAPGSGLIMGSRAGDLDAGALLSLMQVRNLKAVDAQTYVQTYGGLRGLAGESDLRYLLDQKSKGNPEATLAIESFVYGIQKVIGAYLVALSGIDALIFTATAGERSPVLRSLITLPLSSLKIQIDEEKNNSHISVDGVISKPESTVLIGVLRGDEASEILKVTQSIN